VSFNLPKKHAAESKDSEDRLMISKEEKNGEQEAEMSILSKVSCMENQSGHLNKKMQTAAV